MKKQTNRNKHSTSKFRVKNKIMLDAKYIKTMKSIFFLNHKNLDLYKITRAINNIVYELDLLEIMNNLFNVFHSWLLHLNDERFFQSQMKKTSSRIKIDEIIEWSIQKIIDSRINDRKNDSRTNIKKCLQYRIKFVENDIEKVNWQNWIDAKHAIDLIIDFHHKYSNKVESHVFFASFANWISKKV